MPDVIFNGPEGRLEGRYHVVRRANAPIALLLHPHPEHGGTMNNKIVYTLYQAFARRGFAALRFNFRGVGRSQGGFDRGDGSLSAAQVIVACNGYMPEQLHRHLAGRILPVQSNIIVTRPLKSEERAAQRWRNDCPTADSRHVFFYYRLLPDGRLMLGGRGAMAGHPRAADGIYRWMERRLGQIWPHWRGIEISHRWRGLVCLNTEGRPSIGKFPDDPTVMFGFGYHGYGVNTATWTGRALAEWLAGSNSGDAVIPNHLPAVMRGLVKPFPLPGLRKLALQAAMSVNRLRDFAADWR